jgi:hypothetical protein
MGSRKGKSTLREFRELWAIDLLQSRRSLISAIGPIDILFGWFTVALPSTNGEHREH